MILHAKSYVTYLKRFYVKFNKKHANPLEAAITVESPNVSLAHRKGHF
jgi:hypothetical protein